MDIGLTCIFPRSIRLQPTCLQGEFLSLRLPDMNVDDVKSEFAFFLFDDGGMKALAAALVWTGCVYVVGQESAESLRHPRFVQLVKGLLGLPTLFKKQADDVVSGTIQRIIKQNIDAKKLPVSSFEWAGILSRLGEEANVADCVKMYNNTPEVVAHGSNTAT